jgi:hypothetical protein
MFSVNQPTIVRVVNLPAQSSVQNPVLNPNASVVLLNAPSQPLNPVLQLPPPSPVIVLQRQATEPSRFDHQLVSSGHGGADSVSVQSVSHYQQSASNSTCTTTVPSSHQTPVLSTSVMNVISTALPPACSSSHLNSNPPFILLNVPMQTSNPILQLPSQNPILQLPHTPSPVLSVSQVSNPILQLLGQNPFSVLPPVISQSAGAFNQPPVSSLASCNSVCLTSELATSSSHSSSSNNVFVNSSSVTVEHDYASMSVQSSSSQQPLAFTSPCTITSTVSSCHETPVSSSHTVDMLSTTPQSLDGSNKLHPAPPLILLNLPTQTSNPILQLPSQNPILQLPQTHNPILQLLGQNQFSLLPSVAVQPSVTTNPPASTLTAVDSTNATPELAVSSSHSSSPSDVTVDSSNVTAEHGYATTSFPTNSDPQQLACDSACTASMLPNHQTPTSAVDVLSTAPQSFNSSNQLLPAPPLIVLNLPTQASNPILQLPSQNPILQLPQTHNPILQLLGQNQFSLLPSVAVQPSVTTSHPPASALTSTDSTNTTRELAVSCFHPSSSNGVINSTDVTAEPLDKNCQSSASEQTVRGILDDSESSTQKGQPSCLPTSTVNSPLLNSVLSSLMVPPQPSCTGQLLNPSVIMLNLPLQPPNPFIQLPLSGSSPFIVLSGGAVVQSNADGLPQASDSAAAGGIETPASSTPEAQTSTVDASGAAVLPQPSSPNDEPTSSFGGIK